MKFAIFIIQMHDASRRIIHLQIIRFILYKDGQKMHYTAEFPLVLKSRGPGTSSSMKLGVLFAFQGSPDYYRSFFFFSRVSLFIF